MTIAQWLEKTTKKLEAVSIPTARLDAEVLLSDVLQKDRAWLLAHPDYALQGPTLQKVDELVERRLMHEPIAYIRGMQEFYGREFYVTPDTLTPRPETETLVELALEVIANHEIETVADIGTGSGCIIITIEQETDKKLKLAGYDVSKNALAVARKNAEKFNSTVTFYEEDITSDKAHRWKNSDLVVANLPYVPRTFTINLAATHEPELAIYGGDDGLDYYRDLFKKSSTVNKYIATESLPPQHESLLSIAKENGYTCIRMQDFIQVFERT